MPSKTEETAESAVRVRIEGRVQGIGFRYWTVEQATVLGLRGWVRNRFDGSVEAVFAGPGRAVAEMVRRCRRGPPYARITRVEETEEPGAVGPGFHLEPTG